MFRQHPYLHAAPADGGQGGGAAAVAATATTQAASTQATQSSQSTQVNTSALAAAANSNDWLPEKFRVVAADGKTIDLEASARKLATEGYTPLEKRLGTGELPPAKVEDYKLVAPQGLDETAFKEFAADPATQEFVKAAHAKGFTNDQMNFVMDSYLKAVTQQNSGDQTAQAEACVTQLKQVWKTDADFKTNMQSAYRVANALAAKVGMSFADLESSGLANNPVFVRLAAALGPELAEDVNITGDGQNQGGQSWQDQVDAITAELEKLPAGDKKRAGLLERKNALYEQKYPSRAPRVLKKS